MRTWLNSMMVCLIRTRRVQGGLMKEPYEQLWPNSTIVSEAVAWYGLLDYADATRPASIGV